MEDYLRQRNLNPKKSFHCLNPNHADRNPSMRYDQRRMKVHCFSCGADYDIFDVVGLEHGLAEVADIFAKTYEILGLEKRPQVKKKARERKPLPGLTKAGISEAAAARRPAWGPGAGPAGAVDFQKYFDKVRARLGETDYPRRRGLSEATCLRFGLGFDPAFKAGKDDCAWRALIIPTGPGSFTARNTDPEADKSRRVRKRGASPVFNTAVLWEEAATPVFIVEGEIDALGVAEAGAEAVALGSTANVGALLKILEARPARRTLIVALDNDEEGGRAADKLEEGLKALSARFFRINPYGASKDAGEALLDDPEGFSEALKNAEGMETRAAEVLKDAYLATSAARRLAAFKGGISAGLDTPAQPTGFTGLDLALDGGLFEGLYIIGGISSLGKTSFVTQMADQLAQAGREVLIFSLEMARDELMAKSLSRLTLLKALSRGLPSSQAKTARGLTCGARYAAYNGTELGLIDQAIEEYEKYADKIFISEGRGDIGAAAVRLEVEKHLRVTGRRPVAVIDYLQILAPPSERATDKQNTDKNVLELKRLSRDFKIPVIGLSSFNRANYRESVNMEAFKESGAIEYSSDVLMGLQLKGAGEKDFDALSAKEKNPRQVELVILKNRQGPAGKNVAYEYYPLFNYFKEIY